ncbi:precorrin-2 dehydrogenase/sirohydrochlorin ferrochelatase family protein [Staphylococcus lutrae]|uniref:precorrin-2 dehydrogenase n=1 Tax=Staphylococcus lutrae TaxID=155085 RepID=A0AAC9WJ30_9STAP|nr:NAD(P)-dependent oxidoreductase [Staphylococcus lutrae]ARJ50553.1 siroheme synthase [Staphylococcus lutrae]PNZ36339.1 NAD(P)-dependent oxidoreductase [Staphylococcus lutrae]
MYTVQLKLAHRKVVIIGGGKIAWRKFEKLKDEAGSLKVVSPEFEPAFTRTQWGDHIQLIQKRYETSDIADADLIVIATNDQVVNQHVRDAATSKQWVNHTGDRTQSDFYNSLDIEHQGIKVSLSSDGQAIHQVKDYAAKIKAFLATLEEDEYEQNKTINGR